jgi:hypothetical protein
MSKMPPVNQNTTQVIIQHTLGCSEPVLDIGTRYGSSQAIQSPDPISLPPVPEISNTSTNEPSLLTMPSSGMQNSQNGQWVSARRVE